MNIQAHLDDVFKAAVLKVAEERHADVFVYIGPIMPHCDCKLEAKIAQIPKTKDRPNVELFLITSGGLPDVGYRITRALQRRAGPHGTFTVVVNTYCKSTGTLIALGADELVIGDRGELGPLDIQIQKKDEFDEYMSGLTTLHALATLRVESFKAFQHYFLQIRENSWQQISTASAAQIATKLTTDCFSSIYQQIDPFRLGETERAMEITYRYGARLDRGNLEENSLQTLVADYPSHSYVIDREEAEELFKRVRRPSESERKLACLIMGLWGTIHEETAILIDCLSVPADNSPNTTRKKGTNHAGRKPGSRGTQSARDKTRQNRTTAPNAVRQQVLSEGDDQPDNVPSMRTHKRPKPSNGTP